KNTSSGFVSEGKELRIGLGKRKQLNQREIKTIKEQTPSKFILLSKQDGGITESRLILYVTEWEVSHEKQRFYFKDGKFKAGPETEIMLPRSVPTSHFIILGQLGREVFEIPRFHGIRLYGDRHIDSGEMIFVVTFEQEDGESLKMVFQTPREARIMEAFSKVVEEESELKIVEVEELTPRIAFKVAPSGVSGPTALIDLARENSLEQNNKIAELEDDIKRGKKAKEILNMLQGI
ncbi:MAG: hypothetical protein ACW98Y_22115, partial [Candidatus Thorarchaeota archaeon]